VDQHTDWLDWHREYADPSSSLSRRRRVVQGYLRGILAGLEPTAEPIRDPIALWREDYADEPFVEVSDEPPALRDVVGRNVARVYVTAAANAKRPALIVISAIDNLLKGAGGQAVQNANLMLGLDERAGLPR